MTKQPFLDPYYKTQVVKDEVGSIEPSRLAASHILHHIPVLAGTVLVNFFENSEKFEAYRDGQDVPPCLQVTFDASGEPDAILVQQEWAEWLRVDTTTMGATFFNHTNANVTVTLASGTFPEGTVVAVDYEYDPGTPTVTGDLEVYPGPTGVEFTTPGILSDKEIEKANIIEPFAHGVKRHGVISYGCSHYGYDIRLGHKIKVFTHRYQRNGNLRVVDPKNIDEEVFDELVIDQGESFVIPPHSYILGESIERFTMPEDVIGVCLGKSSYARCALIVNVTPLEPGWVGTLTLEISNSSPSPVRVYPGEGIAQILFFRGVNVPGTTYASKQGKYQNQEGLTLPTCD